MQRPARCFGGALQWRCLFSRAAASLAAHHCALWTRLWLQKEPLLGYGECPQCASATVETAQWSINLSAINCAPSKGKEKKKEDKKRDLQFRHSSVCGGAVLGHFILNILFCYIFSFPSKWNSFLLFCCVPTYLFLFHFFNQRSIKKKKKHNTFYAFVFSTRLAFETAAGLEIKTHTHTNIQTPSGWSGR